MIEVKEGMLYNDGEIVLAGILDNDMYKFTMMQAVYLLYPDVEVSYKFTNRDPNMQYTPEALRILKKAVGEMKDLRVQDELLNQFASACGFLHPMFIDSLSGFRYDPNHVDISVKDGDLQIWITGKWHETILWEVSLMALISYVYFKYVDTDWNMKGQIEEIDYKCTTLSLDSLKYADFGTRRRRSFQVQDLFVNHAKDRRGFVGTSNVYLALKHEVKPIGTMAHEWIMGVSALASLRHANRDALRQWMQVYDGDLGIALTDTFGTDAFFGDFTGRLCREYDGVRHDSGDPFVFADKVIDHYKSQGIDPTTKTIVFSDGLNVELAVSLKKYCHEKIRCSFGIGTHFTNDFRKKNSDEKSRPMNMVIKLYSVDGVNVVKLSDNPIKATGDFQMLAIAKHIFMGEHLAKFFIPDMVRK